MLEGTLPQGLPKSVRLNTPPAMHACQILRTLLTVFQSMNTLYATRAFYFMALTKRPIAFRYDYIQRVYAL